MDSEGCLKGVVGAAVHVLQQVQRPADGQRKQQAVPAGLPRRSIA